jgi:hypothetical protein
MPQHNNYLETCELETICGTMVSIYRHLYVDLMQRDACERLRLQYPSAKPRTLLNPFYNCHGLVFASRRGWIRPGDIRGILRDDGYETVTVGPVLPGDIVTYSDLATDEVTHSGIVVRVENGSENTLPRIEIVSKWGHCSEYVHAVNLCPDFNSSVRLHYWRVSYDAAANARRNGRPDFRLPDIQYTSIPSE